MSRAVLPTNALRLGERLRVLDFALLTRDHLHHWAALVSLPIAIGRSER